MNAFTTIFGALADERTAAIERQAELSSVLQTLFSLTGRDAENGCGSPTRSVPGGRTGASMPPFPPSLKLSSGGAVPGAPGSAQRHKIVVVFVRVLQDGSATVLEYSTRSRSSRFAQGRHHRRCSY